MFLKPLAIAKGKSNKSGWADFAPSATKNSLWKEDRQKGW